jgi:hypothetical protein
VGGAMSEKYTINGIEYTWCGGLGSTVESREFGLKVGDIRHVIGIELSVYAVETYWWHGIFTCWLFVPRVKWCLKYATSFDEVSKFRELLINPLLVKDFDIGYLE